MNHSSGVVILALLIFGPLAVTRIERNIELYCLALGFDLMAHLNAKVRKLCKESPWRPC